MSDQLEYLKMHLDEETAIKLVNSIQDCDKYLNKFVQDVTPILNMLNQQVKVSINFCEKQ